MTATGETFCQLAGAGRSFGNKVALHATDLTLKAGEVVGVAGPNGAGKTTLARMVSGFLSPSTGSVIVGGRTAVEYRLTHGVGYLPEELPRAWRCSVNGFLRMRGVDDGMIGVERACELLGITQLVRTQVHALSKGQWRLTLTAYAALGPPRLLVLDEPDSGLDPNALLRMRALVEACRAAGTLVLILSHQMAELDAVCDRLLFVNGGCVIRSVDAAERGTQTAAQLYHELVT
jgi:ABC-2 type transport system ATP-binding protein